MRQFNAPKTTPGSTRPSLKPIVQSIPRENIRLSGRDFDLSANSFTSLPFAAFHRIAALAEEFEQTKQR